MTRIRERTGFLFVVALLLATLPAMEAGADDVIIDVSTLGTVSVAEMVEEMRGAKLVFIGESHDNRRHHEAQLALIRGMKGAGMKVAVGLEMFRASDQDDLDDWVDGVLLEAAFLRVFDENWQGNYWPLYRPIFAYARERRIPLVGLNVDRSVVRQVSRSGFASLDKREIPDVGDVSCDPSARYRERMERVLTGHMKRLDFVRFCEAQMLWDAAMAWHLIDFLEENPEYTVVVLAGGFHSWKHGIPERVRRISDLPLKVVLPSGGRDVFGFDVTREDADYVWWTGA